MSQKTLFIRLKHLLALYAIASLILAPSFGPLAVYAQEVPTPTPEEQCALDGGTWNVDTGSCDMPAPPPDACPNIEGEQASVPDGFVIDESGNCVEDTSAPAVDACPNIEGDQASVPDGFVVDGNGDCVEDAPIAPLTPTPEEECTAAGGTWNSETSDCYTLAEQAQDACEAEDGTWNGTDCIPDACPNINGAQATLPDGYVMFNNQCIL